MAQSNGDEKLRDTLHGDIQSALGFADIREWGHEGQKNYEEMLDIVMERVLADRKQHELDARIDELISYGREVGLLDLRVKTALHERIAELKAERERLGN